MPLFETETMSSPHRFFSKDMSTTQWNGASARPNVGLITADQTFFALLFRKKKTNNFDDFFTNFMTSSSARLHTLRLGRPITETGALLSFNSTALGREENSLNGLLTATKLPSSSSCSLSRCFPFRSSLHPPGVSSITFFFVNLMLFIPNAQ